MDFLTGLLPKLNLLYANYSMRESIIDAIGSTPGPLSFYFETSCGLTAEAFLTIFTNDDSLVHGPFTVERLYDSKLLMVNVDEKNPTLKVKAAAEHCFVLFLDEAGLCWSLDSYSGLRTATFRRIDDPKEFIARWNRLAESADPVEWEALTGANVSITGERIAKTEITAIAPKMAESSVKMKNIPMMTERFVREARRRILEVEGHNYDDYCWFFPGSGADDDNAVAFADQVLQDIQQS